MSKQVIRSMLATTALAWFGMSPAQAMRCAGETIRSGSTTIGTTSPAPLRAATVTLVPSGRSAERARRPS